MKIPSDNLKNRQVVIIQGPKQAVAYQTVVVAGPKKPVAGAKENVAPEDSLVATWSQMLTCKNIPVLGPKKGVVGGKDFHTVTRTGATQTTSALRNISSRGQNGPRGK